MAGVPDTDGDGAGDLLIGSHLEGLGGRAYLFSGASGALLLTLQSPHEVFSGNFGLAVAGLHDVDGDGRGDLLVGAYRDATLAGRAYLFSGRTGALIHEFAPPPISLTPREFGYAVAGVADVEGDGIPDVAVGAPGERISTNPERYGRVYVYSGASGAFLYALTSPSSFGGGLFSFTIAGVTNGAGPGQGGVLVSAPTEPSGDLSVRDGAVYLFRGSDGALLRRFVSPRPEDSGYLGWSACSAGDTDGDGTDDVLIAALGESPPAQPRWAGTAYLFSAATGGLIAETRSTSPVYSGGFGYAVACSAAIGESTSWSAAISQETSADGHVLVFPQRSSADLRPPCPPDLNHDLTLDSQDFFAFLSNYFSGAPAADFNHDHIISSQDFFDFLTAFFDGCP